MMEGASKSNLPNPPRRRRRVSVWTIREAAAAAVARTSLRQVARDVKISAPGLALFIDGSTPRDRTLSKLREWYFSEEATRGGVTVVSARAALDLLVSSLPEEDRRMARLGILTGLHGIWSRRGTAVPAWLVGLMEEAYPAPSGDAA